MPEPARSRARPTRLFLHDAVPYPARERHAERALLLAGAEDVVCLSREVEAEYLGFLSSLGLGPAASNVVVVPGRDGGADSLAGRLLRAGGKVEHLAARLGAGPIAIHPYGATAEVFALARALELVAGRPVVVAGGPPAQAAQADRRPHMRSRAVELGIPVPPGEVVPLPPYARRRRDLEPLRLAIERQLRCTGRVVVRGAGAGRSGTRYVVEPGGDDTAEVLRQVALGGGERDYLVEVLADVILSATVHLRLDGDGAPVCGLGVSERRLGRALAPSGTRYPVAAGRLDSMHEWAQSLAVSLQREGLRGPLNVDFVEYREGGGETRAACVGVRPRPDEGACALALRERLGAAAFVSGVVPTRAGRFGVLRGLLGGLLYDPDRGSGLVPYAPGWLAEGRCAMVALGPDRLQAAELFGRAQSVAGGGADR